MKNLLWRLLSAKKGIVKAGLLIGVITLLAAAGLFLFGEKGTAQAEGGAGGASGSYVYLYQHTDYGGASIGFSRNDPNFNDHSMSLLETWNDEASSIKVPSGVKVTLYEHTYFNIAGGRSVVFTNSNRNFNDLDFNDIASSIKIESLSAPSAAPANFRVLGENDQTLPSCYDADTYIVHFKWGGASDAAGYRFQLTGSDGYNTGVRDYGNTFGVGFGSRKVDVTYTATVWGYNSSGEGPRSSLSFMVSRCINIAATCDASFPEDGFSVCYAVGTDFSGSLLGGGPKVSKIDYDWGYGEVFPSRSDNISARWRGKMQFDGRYRVEGYADDGVIIMVGSKKVVDKLASDGSIWAQYFQSEVFEADGSQNIQIWWNERDGLAALKVDFVSIPDEPTPPPPQPPQPPGPANDFWTTIPRDPRVNIPAPFPYAIGLTEGRGALSNATSEPKVCPHPTTPRCHGVLQIGMWAFEDVQNRKYNEAVGMLGSFPVYPNDLYNLPTNVTVGSLYFRILATDYMGVSLGDSWSESQVRTIAASFNCGPGSPGCIAVGGYYLGTTSGGVDWYYADSAWNYYNRRCVPVDGACPFQ